MAGILDGKTAWITGAGSGIGEAAALELAAAGAYVFLSGRREEPLRRVAAEISGRGGRAQTLLGDLAAAGTAAAIVASIELSAGRLDILVNNAGTNIPDRSWSRMGEDDVATVIDGNLTSAFHAALAVLPVMRRQGDGVIINMASTAGRQVTVQPGSAYSAAKHGVVAMSHSLNLEEFQNGIRATALCPGEVATPIIEKRPVPVDAAHMKRMLQPADLAGLILYIATLPRHICLSEIIAVPTGRAVSGCLGLRAMLPSVE